MNAIVDDVSQLQTQQFKINAPFGYQDLALDLPQSALLRHLDLTGVTIQKGEDQPLEIDFDTALRFAPGSHLAIDYPASRFVQGKERKSIDGGFNTVISVNVTPDGQRINTVFELTGKGAADFKPLAMHLNATFSVTEARASSFALPQTVPGYIPRRPIRASRILAMYPHSHMANYYSIDATPPVPDVRITDTFRVANDVQPGGYLIFHESGSLTYMPAQEFENTYQLEGVNSPPLQSFQAQAPQPLYRTGYGPRSSFPDRASLRSSLLPTGLPMSMGGDSDIRDPAEQQAYSGARFPPHPLAKAVGTTHPSTTAAI